MADGGTWTVRRILEWTTAYFTRKDVFQPRLSAEQLLAHILNYPRIKLYTDYERALGEEKLAAYRGLVQRATEDEPIAYLTGKKPFFNLEFEVTGDVLIPRPDTETLVENVLQYFRHLGAMQSPRVLDLCTGSGCIAAAIAHHHKTVGVWATEISPAAAAVARRNFERLGLTDRITLLEGDLFDPITRLIDAQPFDVIVSNPPYIPSRDIAGLDKSVKDYEPHLALDGGADGLAFHRRILADAPARLSADGRLFIEIQFDQGPAVVELAQTNPALQDVRILKDAAGHERVVTGTKKGPT